MYEVLERLQPLPMVSLNRAAAVAMVDGLRRALALVVALVTNDAAEHRFLERRLRASAAAVGELVAAAAGGIVAAHAGRRWIGTSVAAL